MALPVVALLAMTAGSQAAGTLDASFVRKPALISQKTDYTTRLSRSVHHPATTLWSQATATQRLE
jgi:hypothetical protein